MGFQSQIQGPFQVSITLSLTVAVISHLIFYRHKFKMTESCIKAVISTSERGEIFSIGRSLSCLRRDEMIRKLKSVIGNVVEVYAAIQVYESESSLLKNRFYFNPI